MTGWARVPWSGWLGLGRAQAIGAYEKAIQLEEDYQITDNVKKTGTSLLDKLKKKIKEGL